MTRRGRPAERSRPRARRRGRPVKRPFSIFDLAIVRKLLLKLATADYSQRQIREIARGWRRDLDQMIKTRGPLR